MKITITKEHIAMGIRERGGHCPLALAVNSAIRKSTKYNNVFVYETYIQLKSSDNSCSMLYSLPKELQKFVHDIDSGKPKSQIKPFSCELDLTKPLKIIKH